jgi:Cytochrome C oxidase, cbb3-type, subunit III
MSAWIAPLCLCLLPLLAGCDENVTLDINLQRMMNQPRYRSYDATPYFEDGRSMRTPPSGTIPRGAILDPAIAEGRQDDSEVMEIPYPVTRDRLLRGRARFEIWCAACHGIRGDGESRVAAKMELRPPPSLVDARVRGFSDGRIYRAIHEGYGLMRSYSEDLVTPEERWSVVAYLRALQLSQGEGVHIDALPPRERRDAEKELR